MESINLAVQSIPLTRLRPNPNNPRKMVTDEAVEKKAKSLQANGQETPIKVRPLAPMEKQAASEQDFELIDGELRYRAALKLGWTTLDALVYDIAAEEAEWKSVLSNEWEQMHWLARYEAIEKRLASPSQPTQQQVADELGISQPAINRVVRLMKMLDDSSRSQIYQALIKKDGSWELTEYPVFPLTALENPEMVERALKVLIDHQFTEAKAKKLVEWIQAGHEPETFGEKSSKSMPDDPYAGYWDGLPGFVKVGWGKKGYEIRLTVPPSLAVTAAYGAMSNIEYVKGLAQQPEDMKYRLALPKVTQAAAKTWLAERQSQAQEAQLEAGQKKAAEEKKAKALELKAQKAASRKAALQAKAQARADKAAARESAKAERQSAVRGRRLAKAKSKGQQPGMAPASAEASAGRPSPRPSPDLSSEVLTKGEASAKGDNDGGLGQKDGAKGFLGKIGDALQQKTGLTPQDLKDGVEGMLAKDAKQAVNYQIRRGMRNILKDLF